MGVPHRPSPASSFAVSLTFITYHHSPALFLTSKHSSALLALLNATPHYRSIFFPWLLESPVSIIHHHLNMMVYHSLYCAIAVIFLSNHHSSSSSSSRHL